MIKIFDSVAKLIFVLSLGVVATTFTGCGGRNQSDETGDADSVRYVRDTLDIDPEDIQPPTVVNNLTYTIDFDQKTIKKNPAAVGRNVLVDSVILNLNKRFPKVILEKVKTGHDTLYTVIRDSEVLGEQMGTTGSGEYVATAVLNLTAVQGIRFVKIDMDEHSHAAPGVFARKDFADFKEVEGNR